MASSTLFAIVLLAIASNLGNAGKQIDYGQLKAGDPIPLTDVYAIQDRSGVVAFSINLTESTIMGLDQPNLRRDNVGAVSVTYDSLVIDGQYSQDGIFLVVLPVFGNGNYHIEAMNVTITPNDDPTLDSFFYVNDVNATFEEYLGGGLMSAIGSILENTLGDVVFKYFEPNIQEILNTLPELKDLKKKFV